MDVSIPISIHEWIHSSCKLPKTVYVESAVSLAWMLTKHICRTIATSPEVKLQDHISAENIILFAKQSSVALLAPFVTDIKFHFEMDAISHLNLEEERQPCSPVFVCAALGNLLLEIFSMGRSSSKQMASNDSSNVEFRSDSDSGKNGNAVIPPAEKLQILAKNMAYVYHCKRTLARFGNAFVNLSSCCRSDGCQCLMPKPGN
mmetsp:Transcript_43082/g.90517  ORF Transcript_43082/g.90517 Transcript_43082/m.90517 type:complete len:203 (-) Transcript_43082:734-1342(-)